MEPNRFLFKLTAIFLQYFLIILIIMPFIFLGQLLKYNFSTQNIAFIRVLFFSIAFAMPLVVANAFAFAKFDKIDLKYYLKSKPIHKVILKNDETQFLENTVTKLQKKPFWTLINQSETTAFFRVKNIILTDAVQINLTRNPNENPTLTISSVPLQSYIFLDFGRNYRNILTVLMATQKS